MRTNSKQRAQEEMTQLIVRTMVEEHIESVQAAKKKMAEKLALPLKKLPKDKDIEAALQAYQRIFCCDTRETIIYRLRKEALQIMEFFKNYAPRLVGPVLNGTAHPHSSISIHLFALSAEEINIKLIDSNIPHHVSDRLLVMNETKKIHIPIFSFIAGETTIDLMVFPEKNLRQTVAKRSQQTLERASIGQLKALLVEQDS